MQIWEVKTVACYARAETFTEAVVSVASMVATPLTVLEKKSSKNAWIIKKKFGVCISCTVDLHALR